MPPLGAQYEQLTERYLEAECLTIGPGLKTGMPIRIDNPLEVGADRLVNAIAAYERFGEACVSSTSAPGSTSTSSPPTGEYLGGAIGPGLAPSLSALIERAARITRIDLEEPQEAIGRSTRAGDPLRLHLRLRRPDRRHRRAGSKRSCRTRGCLPPAGTPRPSSPSRETIDEVDDLLTLKGLRLIHERNT